MKGGHQSYVRKAKKNSISAPALFRSKIISVDAMPEEQNPEFKQTARTGR
jgi:hypothetical protein